MMTRKSLVSVALVGCFLVAAGYVSWCVARQSVIIIVRQACMSVRATIPIQGPAVLSAIVASEV